MSQLTKSTDIARPVNAAVWRRLSVFYFMAAAVVIIAAAALIVIEEWRATEQPAAAQPMLIAPDTRLDDYGLRHPAPFAASGSDTRLDDYGFRHPAPAVD